MSILGAIAGDIIGSPYEHYPIKATDFPLFGSACRFTDDTVLTIAVADALLHDGEYARSMEDYYYRYPMVPYGARFHDWASGHDHKPYNSWGNGSAMRVSPVAYAAQNAESVLAEAQRSAEVTHNHPEGVRGAQATALAVFLARTGHTKEAICDQVQDRFGYDLSQTVAQIRPGYSCDLSCQHTVPQAIVCFLDSSGFEETVRNAVSLGGDADTMACIAGSIAAPFYGVPDWIRQQVLSLLDEPLLEVTQSFTLRYEEVEPRHATDG